MKTKEAYNAYMKDYMLRRYHSRVAEAKQILGNHCKICNTTEELEIDHIDWCKKELSLGKLWSVSRKRYLAELEKCQLLCKEHHAQKTKADLSESQQIRESWKRVLNH
jgi:hypothetical protein